MSVFGNVHLGYVVVESDRHDDWRRFGADAIGMHHDQLDADTIRFRLDHRACRFLVERSPDGSPAQEDLTAVGWHVDDHDTFDEILSRVRRAGVPICEGTDDEATRRGVERLWRFAGPKGLAQEIFTRPVTTTAELSMTSSGFVTGEGGLGHIAITSTKPHQLRGYYDTLFDARLSDYIDETISGVKLKIRFLRVNERHHSVAIASTGPLKIDPVRTRIQHLNIQAATLDDMVGSYQRVRELGFDMAWGVGQHTNDRELSYYCVTPSGFEWEVGWNPLVVDENTWNPATHRGISIWGHQPVGATVLDKLTQFRNAAANFAHGEQDVPALSGTGIADD